jgi:hypothetical protein
VKEYDKDLYHQCNKCEEVKLLDQFNKNRGIGCKDCRKKLDDKRMKDPRDCLYKLVTNARNNTKNRENKNTTEKRVDATFDITFDDLVHIYRSQKGLCAYSGLPLQFGNSTMINWKISLERKNQLLGYTKDNVCLICVEFNTGDKRILYNDDSDGSGAWSKEKFEYIFSHIKQRYEQKSDSEEKK